MGSTGLLKSALGSWGFNSTGDIDCLSLGVWKCYSEMGTLKKDDPRDEGREQREQERRARLRGVDSEDKNIFKPVVEGREGNASVVDKFQWQNTKKLIKNWMVLGSEGEDSKLTLEVLPWATQPLGSQTFPRASGRHHEDAPLCSLLCFRPAQVLAGYTGICLNTQISCLRRRHMTLSRAHQRQLGTPLMPR